MKKFSLLLALVASACVSFAQDTLQIEIGESSKVIVTSKTRSDLLKLQHYDFNKIIRRAIEELDSNAKDKQSWILFSADFEDEGVRIFRREREEDKNEEQKSQNKIVSSKWLIDLGLNNYLEKNVGFPEKNNAPYRLQTFNSVYLGIGKVWYFKFGKNSPFSFKTGLMLDWYNFRFVPQNYIVADNNGIFWKNYLDDFGKPIQKSKLVVSYLQIPLMLKAKFYIGDTPIRLGVGGYAGLRVGGRTKINLNNGEKIKERDSYYLNNFRYGLEGNLGIGELTLFCKYDLNSLFSVQNPHLNVLSFGIRL
ncbi:MAG: hypothetical protein RMJ97_10225 [Raineya sp.]|nr:hypothetical protein [Raineya sp.]MDW8297242.1 hypothetical protein [Raineya sp.]